jgi:two-component system phosphate regulon response regulator PhoB
VVVANAAPDTVRNHCGCGAWNGTTRARSPGFEIDPMPDASFVPIARRAHTSTPGLSTARRPLPLRRTPAYSSFPTRPRTAPTRQRRRKALKRKVLIVDDESDIVEFVQYNLRKEMYDTLSAADGPRALQMARQHRPDLILLDLMLPGIDGLEVCRALKSGRETAHIPIIMLTAKGEETDIVTGLEIGADDYVAKPFSMRLLLARMKAVLRRVVATQEKKPTSLLQISDLKIDDDRHEVSWKGQPLQLTLTEYKLLRFLAQYPGRVFTRAQILNNIQDEHVIVIDRAIDVHVAALRKKLGEAGRLIETVRGVGYRFRD